MVPLGYDAKDRKIWVNEEEAERVRIIFGRYLELGSLAPSWAICADKALLPSFAL